MISPSKDATVTRRNRTIGTTTTRRRYDTHHQHHHSENRQRRIQIPPVLIFTHYVDLLRTDLLRGNNTASYSYDELQELRTLQDNVFRIVALHNATTTTVTSNDDVVDTTNTTTVRFLTDRDCVHSIRQWSTISAQHRHPSRAASPNGTDRAIGTALPPHDAETIANELISYFQKESVGM